MPMRCPHCGARNSSDAAGGPCVSCGRVLPGQPEPTVEEDAYRAFERVGGLGEFDPGSPLGLGGDTVDDGDDGGLGRIPTGEEDQKLDLANLLGGGAVDDAAPFFGGRGDDGFRFGRGDDEQVGLGSLDGGFAAFDDDDEATRGNLMVRIPPEALRDSLSLNLAGPPDLGDDDGEEESTRVVDQRYVDEAMRQAPLELGLDAPAPVGWKVRNERGVVYELMTVDAVVAWLEGKPDISGVRVARGDGVFMEVDAFPELAGRLGRRKPVDDSLSLDISRASARHGGIVGERRTVARAEGPAREPGPSTMGIGLVLGAVAAAFLAVIGLVLAGVALGWMSLPPDIEPTASAPPPPSAALARAIGAYEAGHYDAAINQLRGVARGGDADPRIQRYLALALHKNNRDAEARRALAEYRRQMRVEPGR